MTGDALALSSAEQRRTLDLHVQRSTSLALTAFVRIHNQSGGILNATIKEQKGTLFRRIKTLGTATAESGSPFVPPAAEKFEAQMTRGSQSKRLDQLAHTFNALDRSIDPLYTTGIWEGSIWTRRGYTLRITRQRGTHVDHTTKPVNKLETRRSGYEPR